MKKIIILAMCILAITSPVFAGRFQPSEHLFEKSDDFQIIDVSKDFKHYEEGELDYSERDENPEHWGKVIGTESREMVFRTNDYIPIKLQGKVTEEDRQWIINWLQTYKHPVDAPLVRWGSESVSIYINDPELDVTEMLQLLNNDLAVRITTTQLYDISLQNLADGWCYILINEGNGIRWLNDYLGFPKINPEGEWMLPSF